MIRTAIVVCAVLIACLSLHGCHGSDQMLRRLTENIGGQLADKPEKKSLGTYVAAEKEEEKTAVREVIPNKRGTLHEARVQTKEEIDQATDNKRGLGELMTAKLAQKAKAQEELMAVKFAHGVGTDSAADKNQAARGFFSGILHEAGVQTKEETHQTTDKKRGLGDYLPMQEKEDRQIEKRAREIFYAKAKKELISKFADNKGGFKEYVYEKLKTPYEAEAKTEKELMDAKFARKAKYVMEKQPKLPNEAHPGA